MDKFTTEFTTLEDLYLIEAFDENFSENLFEHFEPLPFIQDVIIASLLSVIGAILNGIILFCYRKIKSDIALYIKTFAVVDIFVIIAFNTFAICQLVFQENKFLVFIIFRAMNFIAGHLMLGPLFLALDRALIVGLPHKFRIYQTKMRMAKIVVGVMTFGTSLGTAISPAKSKLFYAFVAISSANLSLQLLVCICLYSFVVARILISNKEMQKYRHQKNK